MRYKITRGGLLFTLAILIVGLGAIVSANNLLFLIVAAMLATLLVSGFVSRLCLAALELDFLVLLAMAKSGIPAADIGKHCDYSGLVSMARSCHPIALINRLIPQHLTAIQQLPPPL